MEPALRCRSNRETLTKTAAARREACADHARAQTGGQPGSAVAARRRAGTDHPMHRDPAAAQLSSAGRGAAQPGELPVAYPDERERRGSAVRARAQAAAET